MLKEQIDRRLPGRNATYKDVVEYFISKYSMKPTIRNFLGGYFGGEDEDGRTFSLVEVENRAGKLYFEQPKTEVIVLVSETMIFGWCRAKKAKQIEDRYSVLINSLNPQPETLAFRETCMHLGKHGGWSTGENWTCFGCGAELVFNDIPLKRTPVGV